MLLHGECVKKKFTKGVALVLGSLAFVTTCTHNFYCTIFPFLDNFLSKQSIFISQKITLLYMYYVYANAKKKPWKNPITEVRRRLYFSSGYKKHIYIYGMVTWRKIMNSLPTTTALYILHTTIYWSVPCSEYLRLT